MLEVRVLGGLEARSGDGPLPLPADARARELLAWLAVHPGLHPRSALAGRLRPDVGEESARKTLRDAVYRLRGALGPAAEALVATREQVGLAGARVDLQELRRLRATGDLEAAVGFARGELLAGLDEDWVLRARDECTAEIAGCFGELAEHAEAAEDLPAAIEWTRRRIEVEPLAEVSHRELVRLLARSDDRPAALAAAGVLAERLRRELGVPPSAATRALVEEVRRGRVGVAGSSGADGDAPPPDLPAPLARTAPPQGRQPALDRLEAGWRDALAGTVRLALAAGEPGIGKTTLAGALARRVHVAGATVLYGRSDERAIVPYQPWVEALEGHLRTLEEADAEHWLTTQEGALARLLPGRGVAGEAGHRERYLAFEAVRALIEDAAAHSPVLLVLDDVHWADEDSLALLRHLAHRTLRARLLVLLCARGAELSPAAEEALADLRRQGPLFEIGLAGLDEAAVAELLEKRTGDGDARMARHYRHRTGGNPFFLDALIRDEQERGTAASGPPPGVRDVLSRRLERLSPVTRDALALASLVGLEFELETVACADGGDLAGTLEALDGAVADELVVPAGAAAGRFAFAHALVVETIVAALSPSRRARLHLRIAQALAERRAVPAGEVARHLRAATPLAPADRVVHWELAAAREATAALAHAEAAAHYEAALASAPENERSELLLALGHARDRAGRRDEARKAFREAAARARTEGAAGPLAQAALGHGGLALVIAAPDAPTTALLEEALAAVPRSEYATRARLTARLAIEVYYADQARTLALAERAVADARASGDPTALAAALNAQRVGLWRPSHARERLAVADEMAAAAEAAGDAEAGLQARNWRVVDLWELGRMAEVRAEIDAYAAAADAVGLPHFRWYTPIWRAGLALMAGRWAEATALGDAALALGEQAQDANAPLFVGIQRRVRYAIQYRHGEFDRDALERTAMSSPVPAAWLGWLANLDGLLGDHDRAGRIVTELTADDGAGLPLDANWHVVCELAEAAAEVQDRAACASLRRRLAPLAGLYPVIARAVCTENVVDYYLGRLAHALGDLEDAEAHLRRAIALNEAAGAGPYAATAHLRLGAVLTDAGRRTEADAEYGEAAARAERLEMPGLSERAGAALARVG